MILEDADKLLMSCGQEFDDVTEYRLLVRCLSEQTVVEDAIRRLKTKEDGVMDSSVLQNPSDPDATFREKAGKQHRGYVANVDEAVGKNGSVILDYQLEPNNYSDSQFLKDSLERNGSQEERTVPVTDGAYFLLNEEGTRVVKCPAGHTPKSSCYSRGGGGHIYVSFPREQCINCPHKEQCRMKVHKKVCSFTISATAQFRAKSKRMMGTEEFQLLARLRNGVETLPSILRRIYHTDRMPVRGCIRSRFFFGCKIAALNVRKLFAYKNGLGHYAQNPLLQTIC